MFDCLCYFCPDKSGLKGFSYVDKSPACYSIHSQIDANVLCHKCDYEPENDYDIDAHLYQEITLLFLASCWIKTDNLADLQNRGGNASLDCG